MASSSSSSSATMYRVHLANNTAWLTNNPIELEIDGIVDKITKPPIQLATLLPKEQRAHQLLNDAQRDLAQFQAQHPNYLVNVVDLARQAAAYAIAESHLTTSFPNASVLPKTPDSVVVPVQPSTRTPSSVAAAASSPALAATTTPSPTDSSSTTLAPSAATTATTAAPAPDSQLTASAQNYALLRLISEVYSHAVLDHLGDRSFLEAAKKLMEMADDAKNAALTPLVQNIQLQAVTTPHTVHDLETELRQQGLLFSSPSSSSSSSSSSSPPPASFLVVVDDTLKVLTGTDHLDSKKTYRAYLAFNKTPCDLYRTVEIIRLFPAILSKNSNALWQYASVFCSTFTPEEVHSNDENDPICKSMDATGPVGLSLCCEHPTFSRTHINDAIGVFEKESCLSMPVAVSPSSSSSFSSSSSLPSTSPPLWSPALYPLFNCTSETIFQNKAANDGQERGASLDHSTQFLNLNKDTVTSKRHASFCFRLPKNTDLSQLGFVAIFDNTNVVGHFTVVPWSIQPTPVDDQWQRLNRILTSITPTPTLAGYLMSDGNNYQFPELAAEFQLHCFTLRGSGPPHADLDDPDAPGADEAVLAGARLVYEKTALSLDDHLVLEVFTQHNFVLALIPTRARQRMATLIEHFLREECVSPDDRAVLRDAEEALREAERTFGCVTVHASGGSSNNNNGSASDVGDEADEERGENKNPEDDEIKGTDDMLRLILELTTEVLQPLLEMTKSPNTLANAQKLLAENTTTTTKQTSAKPMFDQLYRHACNRRVRAVVVGSVLVQLSDIPAENMVALWQELRNETAQHILIAAANLAAGKVLGTAPQLVYPSWSRGEDDRYENNDDDVFVCVFSATKTLPHHDYVGQATKAVNKFVEQMNKTVWNTRKFSVFANSLDSNSPISIGSWCNNAEQLLRRLSKVGGLAVDIERKTVWGQHAQPVFALFTQSCRTFREAPALIVRLLRQYDIDLRLDAKVQPEE